LSSAGGVYANKISTLNGATVTDPFSTLVQKNFTLLSTDGYWNSNAGYQLDGSTAWAPGCRQLAPSRRRHPWPTNHRNPDGHGQQRRHATRSITVNGQQIPANTATTSGGGTS
jgi:hypothetical protein